MINAHKNFIRINSKLSIGLTKMKTLSEESYSNRVIYTSSSKKCIILSSLLTLTTLCIHLILCLHGLNNTWDCKVNSPDSKHDLICYRLIQSTTCRHIYGPFSLDLVLDIQTQFKGYLSIRCPWNTVSSELHLISNLMSFAFILNQLYQYHFNLPKNFWSSKTLSMLLGSLLLVVSAFDAISIRESIYANSNLRTWNHTPHLGSGITKFEVKADYLSFILTPISSFVSLILMQVTLYLLTNTQKIDLD